MASFYAMDISASGLSSERMRAEVIASNLANASSTRSSRGGPYRRLLTVLSANEERWQPGRSVHGRARFAGVGVSVLGIVEDSSPLPMRYDPSHPDADAEGYVTMPNVDPAMEMVDLITASRAYEANVTALNAAKQMAMKALDIGRA
jgi:flagellar basal-body rod protein FlgC